MKISEKHAYEEEWDIVNVLNITYSDYLLAEGMELGMEKGELRKQREIAKKMLGRFSVEDIAEMTALSVDEIQSLEEEA